MTELIALTLHTDWSVLADVKVEHVNLPLTGGPGKHRAGVGSPGDVSHLDSRAAILILLQELA